MSPIAKLKREARAACKRRGHDMRPFKEFLYADRSRVAVSECRRCGMAAHVIEKPRPKETSIGGEAAFSPSRCPKRRETGAALKAGGKRRWPS
jgi:hypothetical protein